MGLACTHFTSPDGFVDTRQPLVRGRPRGARARGAATSRGWRASSRRRSAVLPFPIKGGKLYLYNNNPLLRTGYAGTTASRPATPTPPGRCLVATARRGPARLGVVLLHSPDPGAQATQLLDRGFAAAPRRG